MKKLAILFLLTAVIVSFTFAQVSIKADLGLGNINKGNSVTGTGAGPVVNAENIDPNLTLLFEAKASKDLGPGALTLSGAVGVNNSFQDRTTSAHKLTDDSMIKLDYALPLGPGKLGFELSNKFAQAAEYGVGVYDYYLVPGVSYKDIALGTVNLGFSLLYNYKYDGFADQTANNMYPGTHTTEGASWFRLPGDSWSRDTILFQADLKFAFGLDFTYKFEYGWGKDFWGKATYAKYGYTTNQTDRQGVREIAKIAFLDINYHLGAATVGVEIDDTGAGFRGAFIGGATSASNRAYNTDTTGFTLKPKAEIAVNDELSLGAYLKVQQLMAVSTDVDALFTPGVWVKYSF